MAEQREEATSFSNVRTVRLDCGKCLRPVALTYRPDGYHTGAWSCPYEDCGKIQKIDLPGAIVYVVPADREPDKAPETTEPPTA